MNYPLQAVLTVCLENTVTEIQLYINEKVGVSSLNKYIRELFCSFSFFHLFLLGLLLFSKYQYSTNAVPLSMLQSLPCHLDCIAWNCELKTPFPSLIYFLSKQQKCN